MKRIGLFLMTNFAVMAVLWVVIMVFGLDSRLAANGQNVGSVLGFCAVFGFGGAFISLAMSKWMAKRSTGARVITQPSNSAEMWLLQTVERQARAAGIGMPEVAVYEAPEPNAFATGMNRNKALVAVSTGLLRGMQQDEVEAVLAHEVSHIANGDMVTLTLIQGVVNTFVMFLARLIGGFLDRGQNGRGAGYMITVLVLEVVFGIAATMIVCWFSRQREFRADAGSAHLAGKRKMIAALQRLGGASGQSTLPEQVSAFGIIGGAKKLFMNGAARRLFMTHPPIEERIAALQSA